MSDTVIRVENLSKKYVIGHQQAGGHQTLRDRISDSVIQGVRSLKHRLFSSDDQPGANPYSEEFWALKDVSFEIKQGEIIGIIGRNGAGKSTLLKVLSRITEPTAGRVRIQGRIASLLEVGTGFHPELTGRENIYLNGAILGMSKSEIKQKFDEIVTFSEVEKFLDTPVKHYSSGMYVRLAFAVAAHLEPEILIVDEVLAVGDIQFQKKCLGKMQDVSKSNGRTVLFVSHNMDAVQRLCSQCIMLEQGKIATYSDTAKTVQRYISNNTYSTSPGEWVDISKASRQGTKKAHFLAVQYSSLNPDFSFRPYSNGSLEFSLLIESSVTQSVESLAVSVCNQTGTVLVNADTDAIGKIIPLKEGKNIIRLRIDKLHLNPGMYTVGLWLAKTGDDVLDHVEFAFEIEVVSFRDQDFAMEAAGLVTCQFELLEVS